MPFIIKKLCGTIKDRRNVRWLPVTNSDGKVYEYDTKEEAQRMSRLCYDADPTIIRIVER